MCRVELPYITARDVARRLFVPDLRAAVRMLVAEDDVTEREVGEGRSDVLQLQQRREPFLPQARKLFLGKARTQDDVGHERERAVELRGRRVQRDPRGVPTAARAELNAEKRSEERRVGKECRFG